jgi:hypothetical protein
MRFSPGMRTRSAAFFTAFLLLPGIAAAQQSDPAASRAQLQRGYDLKQQGRCQEAIPLFIESLRLNHQPKGLTNLADCEEKLGKLGSAQAHFVEARDLASSQGLAPLRTLAEQRIQAIEKKIPKLEISLAPGAPSDTTVTRDGVQLGAPSLGSPLPIDPGKHTILARGSNQERQYEVTLSEGETKRLEVTPIGGTALSASPSSTTLPAPTPVANPTARDSGNVATGSPAAADASTRDTSGPGAQRIAGFVGIGLGAVGLAAGTVFGLQLAKKNEEIEGICNSAQACMPADVVRYNDATDDATKSRTLAMVGFGTGAVLAAAGIVLVLTAPGPKTSAATLSLTPSIRADVTGATLGGVW